MLDLTLMIQLKLSGRQGYEYDLNNNHLGSPDISLTSFKCLEILLILGQLKFKIGHLDQQQLHIPVCRPTR